MNTELNTVIDAEPDFLNDHNRATPRQKAYYLWLVLQTELFRVSRMDKDLASQAIERQYKIRRKYGIPFIDGVGTISMGRQCVSITKRITKEARGK